MDRQTLIEQYGTLTEAARIMGIPRSTLSSRIHAGKAIPEIELQVPPSGEVPIEALVSHRIDASDIHPDVVKVFWDIEEGIEFLNWKRA